MVYMPSPEKAYKNIIVTVVGGVLLAGAIWFCQKYLPPLFEWARGLVTALWGWISTDHGIPGWLIILIMPCIIYCGFALWGLFSSQASAVIHWSDYKAGTFFSMMWRWNYRGGTITSPIPYCLTCDTQIIAEQHSGFLMHDPISKTVFECEHCHRVEFTTSGSFEELQDKVTRQIDRNIRNNTWQ